VAQLRLDHNQLNALPISLAKLATLSHLSASGNPLQLPTLDIVASGPCAESVNPRLLWHRWLLRFECVADPSRASQASLPCAPS
jgi:hypothetical protein